MFFQLNLQLGIIIGIIAFFAEYVDSTLGMGYGTALTPILLLFGFDPLEVVPAILLSEFITGISAGFTHHSIGNVNFKLKTMSIKNIISSFRSLGIIESLRRGMPLHLKVVLLIASCSIVGTIGAIFIAINIPKLYLKLYIGFLIFIIGIVILATVKKQYGFSWKKIAFLGLIASFNKGISGGGYGPVVTGGQMISGVDGKNAIGITSMAEGLTCFVGVLAYYLIQRGFNWKLAPYLVIGAILSVPLSAYTVKKLQTNILRYLIGTITILLGLITLIKTILTL
ncbi:MAG: sulfite exporter TauE/SafE family protein [Spirochaetota bacterium]|nr:MAG: sulfite exporter TauE/SafE family protein [Spirochaetota bacterium]